MSLFSQMQRDAAEAQGILAQIQGADAGAKNCVYGGVALLGVFGDTQILDIPTASGGYRRQAITSVVLTRAQFAAPPTPKGQLLRTDIAPQATYLVTAIDSHGPLHYSFSLEKNGK